MEVEVYIYNIILREFFVTIRKIQKKSRISSCLNLKEMDFTKFTLIGKSRKATIYKLILMMISVRVCRALDLKATGKLLKKVKMKMEDSTTLLILRRIQISSSTSMDHIIWLKFMQ